jgi:hypothetical protein
MAGPLSVDEILAKQKAEKDAAAKVSFQSLHILETELINVAQVPNESRENEACAGKAQRGSTREAGQG